MFIQQTGFVLRFDDSSIYRGQLVALDDTSGGYPVAATSLLNAKIWMTEVAALAYAKMFVPGVHYPAHAIEQRVHYFKAEVSDVR